LQHFTDLAKADKERFQKEVAEYAEKEEAENKKQQEAKKTNGFAFFLKKMKTQNQDKKPADEKSAGSKPADEKPIVDADTRTNVQSLEGTMKEASKDASKKTTAKDADPFDLESRFCVKHNELFSQALREINAGRKESCWSWFIFPVAPFVVNGKERGSSQNKRFCLRDQPPNQLKGLSAAKEYLRFKSARSAGVDLRANYLSIMTAVTEQLSAGVSVAALVGKVDEPKLKSSLELFEKASAAGYDKEVNAVCKRALELLAGSTGAKTKGLDKQDKPQDKQKTESTSAEKKRVRFELGLADVANDAPEVKELAMEEATEEVAEELKEASKEATEEAKEEASTDEAPAAVPTTEAEWVQRGENVNGIDEHFGDWRDQLSALSTFGVAQLQGGLEGMQVALGEAEGGYKAALGFITEYAEHCLAQQQQEALKEEAKEEAKGEAKEEAKEEAPKKVEEDKSTSMDMSTSMDIDSSAESPTDLDQWCAKGASLAGLSEAFPDWEAQLPAIAAMPAKEIYGALGGMKAQMAQVLPPRSFVLVLIVLRLVILAF
jgi:uncharacterized protein (DUF1810 family)